MMPNFSFKFGNSEFFVLVTFGFTNQKSHFLSAQMEQKMVYVQLKKMCYGYKTMKPSFELFLNIVAIEYIYNFFLFSKY